MARHLAFYVVETIYGTTCPRAILDIPENPSFNARVEGLNPRPVPAGFCMEVTLGDEPHEVTARISRDVHGRSLRWLFASELSGLTADGTKDYNDSDLPARAALAYVSTIASQHPDLPVIVYWI